MARAQAGQFDEALERFRELMQGLGQNEQEEFAASFSDNLATAAITAGEFAIAREVYTHAPRSVRRQPQPAAEGAGAT